VTGTPQVDTNEDDDLGEMLTMYRRLAAMDPPALRSLAAELARLSDESSASAALQAPPATQARARRDAQRAAAARAALASIESEA
jgi:hypothetical protein